MSDQFKGIHTNQELIDAGWERRFLASSDRAEEAVKTYTEMGFEVRTEKLTPTDFGAGCSTCAASVCSSYQLIYTRKMETKG